MLNKILPTFFCGTAIKITSVFNVDTPNSATVTVKNPSMQPVANTEVMNKDDNGVYSYVLQTDVSWVEGDYIATVSIKFGAYTSVSQQKFTLIRQE